jgi:cytochrome b
MILLLLTTSLIICLSGSLACKTKGAAFSFDEEQVFSFTGTAYADNDERKAHGKRHQGRAQRERAGEDRGDSFWGEFHETSANIMLGLVFLHVIGVIISSRMHNENLVKSMITGNKA